jgi:hypothetical protein
MVIDDRVGPRPRASTPSGKLPATASVPLGTERTPQYADTASAPAQAANIGHDDSPERGANIGVSLGGAAASGGGGGEPAAIAAAALALAEPPTTA